MAPQPVATMEHLRRLLDEQPREQGQPRKPLFVEIGPTISLEDVQMMWEAASLKGGHAEVCNPEMLRGKMLASDFVTARIDELQTWMDLVNGYIGCMSNWRLLMKADLDNRGPHIPEGHYTVVMFGPTLYLDLDQIGSVNDVEEHREGILGRYLEMHEPANAKKRKRSDPIDEERHLSGSLEEARWREKQDRHSLIRINMDFLQIKIEGLTLLRDRIKMGLRAMKQLRKERMYIGCGNGDFSSFRNIVMGPTAMDVD